MHYSNNTVDIRNVRITHETANSPLLQAVYRKEDSVSEIVFDLLSQIEESRKRELAKAFSMMGELDERQRKIVSDLAIILLKKTFLPIVQNFRRAAANNEMESIEVATKLFEIR